MTAESEMRNVILHAAEKLRVIIGRDVGEHRYNNGYQLPSDCTAAMAYAEGMLRLLASYLSVQDAPRVGDRADPQQDGGRARAAKAQRDGHGRFVKQPDGEAQP